MILLKMKNLLKTLSLNHKVYFMNLQEQDKYQEATAGCFKWQSWQWRADQQFFSSQLAKAKQSKANAVVANFDCKKLKSKLRMHKKIEHEDYSSSEVKE